MANIYRKAALDKLSSPEQLDKAIKIIPPSFWIAVIGGVVILAVLLAWSIVGRLPVKVTADGMYMGSGGLQSVVAEADGIVQDVFVREGDEVERGQILAQLDAGDYDEQISALDERKANVESVTFWSDDDPATVDTKPLLDIKSQFDVTGSGLTADQIALRERQSALSKQKSAVSKAKSARNSARRHYSRVQNKYQKAQNKYNSASSDLNNAQVAYNTYYKTIGPDPTEEQLEYLQKLSDEITEAENVFNAAAAKLEPLQAKAKKAEAAYSAAQQSYNTEKTTKKQLADTVSQMEAKVKADKSGTGNQTSSLEKQFISAKGGVLDQIDQELENQLYAAEKMKLKSRADGQVIEVDIAEGNAVQMGMTVCTINYDTGGDETVLFVPVSEGKKIKKGMKAVIYPSTVNRQEYGHMEGEVTDVSDTVISAQDMSNQLGSQALAEAFLQRGPVIGVECSLEKDESTASGYKWSSKKGAEISIDEGTIMQADIVTEEKAPITMLIPYLKEKLTIKQEQEDKADKEN